MPLYEYQCKTNGHRFEVRHGMNDPSPTTCPECGAEVRRVIQPVGIVFKGSGFYATDSRNGSKSTLPAKSGEASESTSSSDDKANKTEAPKSESKPATPKTDAAS